MNKYYRHLQTAVRFLPVSDLLRLFKLVTDSSWFVTSPALTSQLHLGLISQVLKHISRKAFLTQCSRLWGYGCNRTIFSTITHGFYVHFSVQLFNNWYGAIVTAKKYIFVYNNSKLKTFHWFIDICYFWLLLIISIYKRSQIANSLTSWKNMNCLWTAKSLDLLRLNIFQEN